jgi:uncharacterized protein with von Willebrand factor type A (vWA) domain
LEASDPDENNQHQNSLEWVLCETWKKGREKREKREKRVRKEREKRENRERKERGRATTLRNIWIFLREFICWRARSLFESVMWDTNSSGKRPRGATSLTSFTSI